MIQAAAFSQEWLDQLVSSWIAVPLFALLWLVVTGLLASLSGWADLASRYAGVPMLDGERYRFASGAFGRRWFPVNYNGCLFVHLSPEGLGLSILLPFRFRSPALLIPWSRIRAATARRILWVPSISFEIQESWSCIALRGRAGQRAQQWFESARAGKQPDDGPTRAIQLGS
ncbi:MAG: hypothetical protein FJ191_06690 [Gammaproteobacteria bacterium]|nr:hypothetical protein [Gammaproteobacteria bacterium]